MVDDALNILSKMNIVANKILLDESFQLSDLNHNDMLIFATPSWFDSGLDGQPHTSFISFMNKNSKSDFSEYKTAFIGLGDNTYARFCRGIDIVEDYFTSRGASKISDTLKLDSYQFDMEKGRVDLEKWINSLPL
jgi:flavodoxin